MSDVEASSWMRTVLYAKTGKDRPQATELRLAIQWAESLIDTLQRSQAALVEELGNLESERERFIEGLVAMADPKRRVVSLDEFQAEVDRINTIIGELREAITAPPTEG